MGEKLKMDDVNEKLLLLTLPSEIISRIFSYMLYDEICNIRLVCRQVNDVAKQLLCTGFLKVTRQQQEMHKKLRGLLPRRESERRVHPLARKSDILDAIETRLSLLNMTYNKYIDLGQCCFIPGKVLDELRRVMRVVDQEACPPRANELLQELRDISSMAMEHFDEKIVPLLKARNAATNQDKTPRSFVDYDIKVAGTTGALGVAGVVVRQAARSSLMAMRRELSELASKVAEQQKKLQEHERALADKEAKIVSQEQRLAVKSAQFTRLQHELTRQKTLIRRLSVGVCNASPCLVTIPAEKRRRSAGRRSLPAPGAPAAVSEHQQHQLSSGPSSTQSDACVPRPSSTPPVPGPSCTSGVAPLPTVSQREHAAALPAASAGPSSKRRNSHNNRPTTRAKQRRL